MRSLIAIAGLLLVTGCGTSPDTTTPAAGSPSTSTTEELCLELADIESSIAIVGDLSPSEQDEWFEQAQTLAGQGAESDHPDLASLSQEILATENDLLGVAAVAQKIGLMQLACNEI